MHRFRDCLLLLCAGVLLCGFMAGCTAASGEGVNLSQQELNVTFVDTRQTASPKPAPTNTPAPPPRPAEPVSIPGAEDLAGAQLGSVVRFGSISLFRGEKDPMPWIVTDVRTSAGADGQRVKELELLSVYVVAYEEYNERYAKTTWEKCSLRKWLQNQFLFLFSFEEKKCMMEKENRTSSGTVRDLAWIPSESEYRQMRRTVDPLLHGLLQSAERTRDIYQEQVGWWLRGTGEKSAYAPWVTGLTGDTDKTEVDNHRGVRPMIRIRVPLP